MIRGFFRLKHSMSSCLGLHFFSWEKHNVSKELYNSTNTVWHLSGRKIRRLRINIPHPQEKKKKLRFWVFFFQKVVAGAEIVFVFVMVFVSALNLILFNWWQKKEDRRAAATIRECPKFTASRELGSSNNRRPRLKTWERPRCRRFSLKTLFTESSHRRCWEQVRVAPAALVESLPCKSSQLIHTLFGLLNSWTGI